MTDTLADRAVELAEAATRPPSFDRLRQHLNDVGITASRRRLQEAPDLIANARIALAEAKEVERQAKDGYLAAVTEAEWLLQPSFEVRSNKQWLVFEEDAGPDGGHRIAEADQRSFTADEKKSWIADRAAKQPDVRTAMVAYSGAERARARAADDLAVAEMRFSAAKHDLDAAAAELTFCGLMIRALPTPNQES